MKKRPKLKIVLCKLPTPNFLMFKKWGGVPLGVGYLKAMAYKEGLMDYVDIKIIENSGVV